MLTESNVWDEKEWIEWRNSGKIQHWIFNLDRTGDQHPERKLGKYIKRIYKLK